MKFLKHSYLIVLLLMISCNGNENQLDLSEVMDKIKVEGNFKNIEYEFAKSTPENGKEKQIIMVTLFTDDEPLLGLKEFSKESATAIYNYNYKSKTFDEVWITIEKKVNESGALYRVSGKKSEHFYFKSKDLIK